MRTLPISSVANASLQNILHSYSSYSTPSQIKASHMFVPRHEDANSNDIKTLSEFVNTSRKLLAITGKYLLRNFLIRYFSTPRGELNVTESQTNYIFINIDDDI